MKTFEDRQVRVFISSTFRDMHGEREVLIKHVFPRLRQKCREQDIELTEIDLRWGLTEEQTQNMTDVVRICLEEIDLCKGHPPFFLSLLGEQYGTVVKTAEFQTLHSHKPDFEWLKNYPPASVTELEIIHAIFSRLERGSVTFEQLLNSALFYMRSPAYIDSVPAEKRDNFVNDDTVENQRALKNRIRDKGLPVTDYQTPKDLENLVFEQLWDAIKKRFPHQNKHTGLEEHSHKHNDFAENRTKTYIERFTDLKRLDAHAASEDQPLIILGESGKSALLAHWALKYQKAHPQELVISYFIGSSPNTTDYVFMLRYVMGVLKAHYQIAAEIEFELELLLEQFTWFLEQAQERTILILDGLNQLDEDGKDLVWLPEKFPSQIRLFLSTNSEIQRDGWQTYTIAPLIAAERESLITDYLKHYRKALNAERTQRIASASQTENPLYLKVLLEELRVFGSHAELDKQIEHYLAANNPIELYTKVLERLEADYEQERPQLVKEAFSLLWAARRGLTVNELLKLLEIPQFVWTPLFLAVQDALVDRNGLLNFFHDYLREAVAARYLPTLEEQQSWHLRLADYFEKQSLDARIAEELPWQLYQAGTKERLQSCLSQIPVFLKNENYELWHYWQVLSPEKTMVAAYEQALIDYEQTEKPEDEDLAGVLNSLGSFFYTVGYLMAAEPLFKRALKIFEKVLGKEHPNTAASLSNLAELYRAKGDYSKAEPLFKRALKIFEKVLGKEHPSTTTILNNLAELYRAKGDYSKAEPLFKRALEIYEKVLGKEHPSTATILNNLAALLRAKRNYSKAEPLYKRALAIREKVFGKEHPETAASLDNLALLYRNKGDYDSAEPLHKRALFIYEKVLGKEHLDTAISSGNLASLYFNKGDYDSAEPLLKRTLAITEKVLGKEHPETVAYRNDLESCRAKRLAVGTLANAPSDVLDVLLKRLMTENHSLTASYQQNNQAVKPKSGEETDEQNASALIKQAIALHDDELKRLTTENHSQTTSYQENNRTVKPESRNALSPLPHGADEQNASALIKQGKALYDKGDYDNAEQLYRRALAISQSDQQQTAIALNNLASLYRDKGDYDQAYQLYHQALAIFERKLGSQHPNTDHVRNQLNNLPLTFKIRRLFKTIIQWFK